MNELKAGQQIGNYILIKPLGRGGLGEVWLARHAKFTNKPEVAIKFVLVQHSEMFNWFEREASILDLLRANPHIITAEDYGQQNGLPYLVMKYAAGGSLSDRIKRPLPPAIIANYTEQIADALDFAHKHGVVHRDLKPSNVLFDANEFALLADFGIAHTDDTNLTRTGAHLGTPGYMSPEQFVDAKRAGPPADIYSLGVIAFRMLTGQLPFQAKTPGEFEMSHRYSPVPKISDYSSRLPPAVQPILEKALAKNPAERYQTAGEFSNALKTALASESGDALEQTTPISRSFDTNTPTPPQPNRPPMGTPVSFNQPNEAPTTPITPILSNGTPAPAQTQKKFPVVPVVAAVVVVALIAAGILALNLLSSNTSVNVQVTRGNVSTSTVSTNNPASSTPGATSAVADPNAKIKLKATAAALPGHGQAASHFAFSNNGSQYVTGANDRTARLWETASGKELGVLYGFTGNVSGMAFSPDGQSIAVAGSFDDGKIRLWDGKSSDPSKIWQAHQYDVGGIAWMPDGKTLISFGSNAIKLWQLPEAKELKAFTTSEAIGVAFSRDGRWVATGHQDGSIKVWDTSKDGSQTPITLKNHTQPVYALEFSADAKRLASASDDGTMVLWQMDLPQGGSKAREFTKSDSPVRQLALSPDGKIFISRDFGGAMKVWNTADGTTKPFAPGDFAGSFGFSPDGKIFAVNGCLCYKNDSSYATILFDVNGQELTRNEKAVFKGHQASVQSVATSADGQNFITASDDRALRYYDNSAKLTSTLNDGGTLALFSNDKKQVYGVKDSEVVAYDLASGSVVRTFKGSEDYVSAMALSPDGKKLYTANGTDLRLWDVASGRELATLPYAARNFKLSADGRFVLTQELESYRLIDVSQSPAKEVTNYKISGNDAFSVSNDGKIVAIGGYDMIVRLYDDSGKEIGQLRGHSGVVQAIAFVPGRPTLLATAAADNTVRVWELNSPNQAAFAGTQDAREVSKITLDKMGALTVLGFDTSGKTLFTGHADGSFRVWEVNL